MANSTTIEFLVTDLKLIGSKIRGLNVDLPLALLLGCSVIFSFVIQSSALNENLHLLPTHMLRISMGFVVMILIAQLPVEVITRFTPLAYLFSIGLLILVMYYGDASKGATRWLDFPGIPRFQPSELAKITIPLMLAWYLAEKAWPLRIRDLLVSAVIIGLPVTFVFMQPDLGTTVLVTLGSLSVVFLAGIRWKFILWTIVILIPTAYFGIDLVLSEYQISRLRTYMSPEADVLGTGWNIAQSKTALGSGGLFGKGLGEGTQSQLNFLPEGHTDFILAVVGEEFGFIGSSALVVLMLAIFWRGMYLCYAAPDNFARYSISGIVTLFFIYALTNCMMVCGLAPVVGAPLPLISYGSSSALTFLAGFGVIMALRTRPR